jgi:hypothetical protein
MSKNSITVIANLMNMEPERHPIRGTNFIFFPKFKRLTYENDFI